MQEACEAVVAPHGVARAGRERAAPEVRAGAVRAAEQPASAFGDGVSVGMHLAHLSRYVSVGWRPEGDPPPRVRDVPSPHVHGIEPDFGQAALELLQAVGVAKHRVERAVAAREHL
jgi:hypothetical protein